MFSVNFHMSLLLSQLSDEFVSVQNRINLFPYGVNALVDLIPLIISKL